jgi:hypothetical protein
MTAREIALAKVAEKKQRDLEANHAERERANFVYREGQEFNKKVARLVNQFKDDFNITHIKDKYAWKFRLKRDDHWPPKKDKEFYVVLAVHTSNFRPSDESDEEVVSNWAVTVEIQDYNAKFNPTLRINSRQDFYCRAVSGSLETDFGEYMARWY